MNPNEFIDFCFFAFIIGYFVSLDASVAMAIEPKTPLSPLSSLISSSLLHAVMHAAVLCVSLSLFSGAISLLKDVFESLKENVIFSAISSFFEYVSTTLAHYLEQLIQWASEWGGAWAILGQIIKALKNLVLLPPASFISIVISFSLLLFLYHGKFQSHCTLPESSDEGMSEEEMPPIAQRFKRWADKIGLNGKFTSQIPLAFAVSVDMYQCAPIISKALVENSYSEKLLFVLMIGLTVFGFVLYFSLASKRLVRFSFNSRSRTNLLVAMCIMEPLFCFLLAYEIVISKLLKVNGVPWTVVLTLSCLTTLLLALRAGGGSFLDKMKEKYRSKVMLQIQGLS